MQVHNHNLKLLAKYTDNKSKDYVGLPKATYIGFSSQEFSGLEVFFKNFLQPFLPAGVVLESISIKSKLQKRN